MIISIFLIIRLTLDNYIQYLDKSIIETDNISILGDISKIANKEDKKNCFSWKQTNEIHDTICYEYPDDDTSKKEIISYLMKDLVFNKDTSIIERLPNPYHPLSHHLF
jgi:hypothetical protein